MIRVIRDIFRVLNMPCQEHAVLMSRQLDAPLRRGEAIGLRVHVVYCRACRRFRRQIRLVRELCGTVGAPGGELEGMPESVRGRLAARVRGESTEG